MNELPYTYRPKTSNELYILREYSEIGLVTIFRY